MVGTRRKQGEFAVLRSAYIIAVAVLTAAAAVAFALFAPMLPARLPLLAAPAEAIGLALPWLRWLLAAGLGFVLFFLLGYLAPAVVEAVGLASLLRRLRDIAAHQRGGGGSIGPAQFGSLVAGTPLARAAEAHVAALWSDKAAIGAKAPQNWWATVSAAASFRGVARARARRAARFALVAFLVFTCGAAAIAWASRLALLGNADVLAPASLLFAAAAAASLPMLVATWLFRMGAAGQADAIAAAVDEIFPPITGNALLTQITTSFRQEGVARDAAVAASQNAVCGEIAAAAREVRTALHHQDDRVAAAVAGAIGTATAPLVERIDDVAARLSTDHAEAAKRLLDAVTADFAARLDERLGDEWRQLGALLAGTTKAADEMRQRFRDIVSDLAAAQSEHESAVVERLGAAITAAAGEQRAAIAAFTTWSEALAARIEELTRGAVEGGGNAIGRLADLLARTLDELGATQRQLSGMVEAERATADAISAAAASLAEIGLAARDGGELRPRIANDVSAEDGPADAGELDGFVRALGDLRSETDAALGSLPRL
jgi:hypothetical protein